jgi:hypothetical protein
MLPQVCHPFDSCPTRLTRLAELAPGKLVKDEHFTLFEAVSALEVRESYKQPRAGY